MMYTACLQFFMTKYIDMQATQKRQIADIETSEGYVHCSQYKTNDFVFLCSARINTFSHEILHTFSIHPYVNVDVFSDIFETLKCDF